MKRTAVMFVALALVLAACQSATEQLSEKLAEQAVGVNDVDIDTDTGKISVETDEGSFTLGGGEIPEGFPVPVPDGGRVTASFVSDDSMDVSISYEQSRFEEIVAHFDSWTNSQTNEWSTNTSTVSVGEDGTLRTVAFFSGVQQILVSDCVDASSGSTTFDRVCVTMVGF